MVRLDQDRNYPEFPIYNFINEDCFDSNPQAGWLVVVVVVLAVLSTGQTSVSVHASQLS